jgi:hypothetical protein
VRYIGKDRLEVKVTLKQVTILGIYNEVNFQAVLQIDYELDEESKALYAIESITNQFKRWGVQPPVPGRKTTPDRGMQSGGNGRHPNDAVPDVLPGGEQKRCPKCRLPRVFKTGFSQKTKKWWKRVYCPNVEDCGWFFFDDKYTGPEQGPLEQEAF